MKKLIYALLIMFCLTGCNLTKNMDNTPTKKVEAFLSKYQTLNNDVLGDLDDIVDKEDEFSEEQKTKYKDIIKSNYQKMTYKIKDEKIDGDEAIVRAEIEVVDYTKIVSEANKYLKDHPEEFLTDKEYDNSLYIDYRLSKLKDAKEKVKYTIEFKLAKADDEWMLDTITDEIRNKINGIY